MISTVCRVTIHPARVVSEMTATPRGEGDVRTSDEEFVERLYRESAGALVTAAYALTGDLTEAEDAVQEAFVRAFGRPEKVTRADNPVAWMRVVTLNIARSRYRRQQRFDRLLSRLRPADERLPGLEPDHVVLVGAIRQLPRKQREAIALYYLADLSVTDISESLHVSQNVVKSRLHRGRQALAELLGDASFEPLSFVTGGSHECA
jgi:RNA polymerase sigma-70 factor (ECF subfamily)